MAWPLWPGACFVLLSLSLSQGVVEELEAEAPMV
jgi:hypothetical protein